MRKFIITEDEKRYIRSLYEQPTSGQTTSRLIKGSETFSDYDATNITNEQLQLIVNKIAEEINLFESGKDKTLKPYDSDQYCYRNTYPELKTYGLPNCANLIKALNGFIKSNEPNLTSEPFKLTRPTIINDNEKEKNLLDTLKKNTYPLSEFLNYVNGSKEILDLQLRTNEFVKFDQSQGNIYKNKIDIYVSIPEEFSKVVKENKFQLQQISNVGYVAFSVNKDFTEAYGYGKYDGKNFSVKNET